MKDIVAAMREAIDMFYFIRRGGCHVLISLCLLFVAPKQSFAGNAGSFLHAYPLPVATNQYQITDLTSPIPFPEGYALSATVTPGEFFPVSFVLQSTQALSGVTIQSSSLTGNISLPSSAVDIRLVKTWYSYSDGLCTCHAGKYLIPELLVKDDALVQ